MSLSTTLLLAFHGLMVASLAFAWFSGGRAERAGVILIILMAAYAWLVRTIAHPQFASVDPFALIEDVAGFAGFTWIGLHARRIWPLCAAALQLLSLGAHFARQFEPDVDPMVYSAMKSGPTLLVCLAIALGAAAFRRRRRAARQAVLPGDDTLASWRQHLPG